MNTNNPTKLKKMPYSCTKGELYEMYRLDMTERAMRNGINAIIKENRGLPKFHKTCMQQVFNKELQEFIAVYGLPRNYEL